METVFKILGAVAAIVVLGIIIAFPVMWLWNWLMPTIFGLITINFWQALGLLLLSNAFFKSSSSSK